ncbi:hypothetical protein DPMN_081383 [Dreissena polymorpha]|uniref:Uncharacterized protein n=1 Tax=Dreissena polymorpha TaxID=45954 RepID=A0A9D3Y8J5_DREPO|nr:hypothetical protein DPMN_081383 [Dreissena polymorpha]
MRWMHISGTEANRQSNVFLPPATTRRKSRLPPLKSLTPLAKQSPVTNSWKKWRFMLHRRKTCHRTPSCLRLARKSKSRHPWLTEASHQEPVAFSKKGWICQNLTSGLMLKTQKIVASVKSFRQKDE